MCDRNTDPSTYDPPITEAQREALAALRRADDYAARIHRRTRNLMALGFTGAEALALARASWRVTGRDAA